MSENAIFNKQTDEQMPAAVSEKYRCSFESGARQIYAQHLGQSLADIERLKKKYSKKKMGRMKVFEALKLLGQCVDPSDFELCCTSQLVHALQTAEYLYENGHKDEMIALGLIHDIGKILLLTDEDPANIVCPNQPVGTYSRGCGLDSINVTWNHDEYAYEKLKAYLPEDYAWLLRFHSLRFGQAEKYMNARDRSLYENLLVPFRKADLCSKSTWYLPKRGLDFYKPLIEQMFPRPIDF